MIDEFLSHIVDESKWMTISMVFALLAFTILQYRYRNSELSIRRRVLAALNLFFGVTIGTMVFGHLLAVTIKFILGTLEGNIVASYLIGIVLAVPSWWLIHHTLKVISSEKEFGRRTLFLNVWLAVTLLSFGLSNFPLAVSALFNLGYQLNTRILVGWVIVSLAVLFNVGLLIGSLIFLASGQSFEQFKGIE